MAREAKAKEASCCEDRIIVTGAVIRHNTCRRREREREEEEVEREGRGQGSGWELREAHPQQRSFRPAGTTEALEDAATS